MPASTACRYLGICLGMQMAVMEYARHVLGLTGAHSSEVDPNTPYPVIDLMPDQHGIIDEKGGTMRLGAYPCQPEPRSHHGLRRLRRGESSPSATATAMSSTTPSARRSRASGMLITGTSPTGELVETVEIPEHPFYIGVQFHPEFKSRPNRAHPLFKAFVAASLKRSKK